MTINHKYSLKVNKRKLFRDKCSVVHMQLIYFAIVVLSFSIKHNRLLLLLCCDRYLYFESHWSLIKAHIKPSFLFDRGYTEWYRLIYIGQGWCFQILTLKTYPVYVCVWVFVLLYCMTGICFRLQIVYSVQCDSIHHCQTFLHHNS